MAGLSDWITAKREQHTCDGEVMPVFLGYEAYLKYGKVTAEARAWFE